VTLALVAFCLENSNLQFFLTIRYRVLVFGLKQTTVVTPWFRGDPTRVRKTQTGLPGHCLRSHMDSFAHPEMCSNL